MRSAADHLIARERGVRRNLARDGELTYAVQKARETLMETRALSGRDAAMYLSILRLGSALGISDDLSLKDFNELLVSMHLGTTGCRDTGNIGDDTKRAKLIRAKLSKKREAGQLTLPEES